MNPATNTPASTPEFLKQLAHAHYARLARCVVITGNIYDLFPSNHDQDKETKFVSLEELLEN